MCWLLSLSCGYTARFLSPPLHHRLKFHIAPTNLSIPCVQILIEYVNTLSGEQGWRSLQIPTLFSQKIKITSLWLFTTETHSANLIKECRGGRGQPQQDDKTHTTYAFLFSFLKSTFLIEIYVGCQKINITKIYNVTIVNNKFMMRELWEEDKLWRTFY